VPPGQGPLDGGPDESGCLVQPSLPGCSQAPDGGRSYVQQFCSGDVCDDLRANTAAVIELERVLPIWVVPDTAPLLVGINAEVRPFNPTVEGILGSEALTRLQLTIDYPRRRLVARCTDAGCLTFPRWINQDADTDCAACEGRRQAAMRRPPPDGGAADLLPGNLTCPPLEPLP
jgi:hypothetical protein